MPELPEVEHFRQVLLPLVSNEQPLHVTLISKSPPKKFPSVDEWACLGNNNCFVQSVERKGKLICMHISRRCDASDGTSLNNCAGGQYYLFLHMGMTGRICTSNARQLSLETSKKKSSEDTSPDPFPPPHAHFLFRVGSYEASFSDPRKFGSVKLCESMEKAFDELAHDALICPLDHFKEKVIGQTKQIKTMLLDQRYVVSGVGNWVADECLYQSAIHPNQTNLTEDEVDRIYSALQSILEVSMQCIEEGVDFPTNWMFHCRWSKGKGCMKDSNGRIVSFVSSGGRTSAIVASIQKKSARKKGETSQKADTIVEPEDTSSRNGTSSSASGLATRRSKRQKKA